MATVATLQADLVKINTAIDAALTAQSYTVGRKGKVMANLDSLYRQRNMIESRIATMGGLRSQVSVRFVPDR